MKFYFAPMEGVAGYIYRNAYNNYFNNIDKFFAPFISTSPNGIKRMKEFRDILPENNKRINLVPQLLSNNSTDFIMAAKEIEDIGYEEINLNVGCPSGTVTSKSKGAGMLSDFDRLDRFLDEVFNGLTMKISVKTRIGFENADDIEELIKIYNRYPVYELIVHPRTRQDFYKNQVNIEAFAEFVNCSKHSLCYNGDIFCYGDYLRITEKFPNLEKIMIGRGILRNPSIVENILQRKDEPLWDDIFMFHDELFNEYKNYLSGDTNLLFKMKEVWLHMVNSMDSPERAAKKIKKIKNIKEYNIVINEFKNLV